MVSGRVDVGIPHVHRHSLDPLALLDTELLEKAVQAGLTALVGEVLDATDPGSGLLTPAAGT